MPLNNRLNRQASALCDELTRRAAVARVAVHDIGHGVPFLDCGVRVPGSLQAGRYLAEICMAGLGQVRFLAADSEIDASCQVQITTDEPWQACLLSQYAGWKVQYADYSAMGSGPMRAAACREQLFHDLEYREVTDCAVGVLEARSLPPPEVGEMLSAACDVDPRKLTLLIAPTASLAGIVQIVSRSVETAMHKLLTLGVDPRLVLSALGSAPLPPAGGDDLSAMGRTNDAILYGAQVHLWVSGSDEQWSDLVPRLPSCSSPDYGTTFVELFARHGGDFYQMDPHLFSPARVVVNNVDTGRRFQAGHVNGTLLRRSFETVC